MRPTAVVLGVLIGVFAAAPAFAEPPDPCIHMHGRTLERCREHVRTGRTVHSYNEPNHPRNEGWEQGHGPK
jgi:hypothetical protein